MQLIVQFLLLIALPIAMQLIINDLSSPEHPIELIYNFAFCCISLTDYVAQTPNYVVHKSAFWP
jgi:hypothetical protein